MEESVFVSVFMLTYNQEQFIAQAIEGVLMQQTNFKYQLVIGEDGSTDNTLEICKAYQEKHPDKIKIISQPQNIGLMNNFVNTYAYLKGKYITICDGDDYWIDPLKLQKQVDVLEANTNVSVVYSRTKKEYPNGRVESNTSKEEGKKEHKNIVDLLQGNFIPSVTVLFKTENLPETLPDWFRSLPYGDWPLYLYALSNGTEIHFINEDLTVYRTGIGESHKLNKNLEKTFLVEMQILNYIYEIPVFNKWKPDIRIAQNQINLKLMLTYNRENRYAKGFLMFLKLLGNSKNKTKVSSKYLYSIYKKVKC